jgi:hypothetical protein
MNEFDDLFSKYPTLRRIDPARLRAALADRELFDRLVMEGDSTLTPEERVRADAARARLLAAAQAKFGGAQSWIATASGWRRYVSTQLHTLLAPGAETVRTLAADLWQKVLTATSPGQPEPAVLRHGSLEVDDVHPETGARARCDDCGRRFLSAPHFVSTPSGVRFVCGLEFDFFDDVNLAARFDGGVCLLEMSDGQGSPGVTFKTKLLTDGHVVRALFDEPAPFAAALAPSGRVERLRLALLPPGRIARAVETM